MKLSQLSPGRTFEHRLRGFTLVELMVSVGVGFVMLMEMVFMGRSFSATTLLGIALVVAPTAWSLIRSAAQHKPREISLPLREAA